jgi:hypothetical protein
MVFVLELQIKTAVMKYLLIIACIFLWIFSAGQNTQSPEQIRQEMARIRQTTNWDDPAAAKKANEQIRELSKKLMAGNQMPAGSGANQQQQGGNTSSKDAQKLNELNQEMLDQKMDIWTQIWKSAAGGEGADILLADPLREEIVEEFKEEESPKSINSEVLEKMTYLYLDMSLTTVHRTIDVMQNFKSINTLIITGGINGVPVDLREILNKAVDYPLTTLYIMNFRKFVDQIPKEINNFSKLQTLAIFNNNLQQIPEMSGFASNIDSLFVDLNPLTTLYPIIQKLNNLKKLSIVQTNISDSEIQQIQTILPNCKILAK